MKKKIFVICVLVIIVICISFFIIINQINKNINPPLIFHANQDVDLGFVLSQGGASYQYFARIKVKGKSDLRQSKIGICDDKRYTAVYSVKGFDSYRWIIVASKSGDDLYKETYVNEIPKELEMYKAQF